MRWMAWTLAGLLVACTGGGGGSTPEPDAGDVGDGGLGGGGGEPPAGWLGEDTPKTLAYAISYDRMVALARAPGFVRENMGDAAAYLGSDATSPTRGDEMSSLYYETDGFAPAVERATDRRADLEDREAGGRIASKVATALTVGFAAEMASGRRGSARWHALTAARALDYYLLLDVHKGLAERSAAGFDRAWALLWRGDAPHALGGRIIAADRACGTSYLADVRAKLEGVREPFAAALEEHGLPDALDRLVIEEGQSPEYDAMIPEVDALLVKGLGTAMLLMLRGEPDANLQAEALAAYTALSPSVRLASSPADGSIGGALDAMNPADIDLAGVVSTLEEQLGVACAAE